MSEFLEYLLEANSAGSGFEKKTASAVSKWLKHVGLSGKFTARRYQRVNESAKRDESFSDIVVENLETKDQFFIECKQETRANIITTQFDINRDFSLQAVKDRNRRLFENDTVSKLSQSIEKSDEYGKFREFMRKKFKLLGGRSPSDFYFGDMDVEDPVLSKLVDKYNKMIENGECEADNKPFTMKMIRDSTRNVLACGLMWRIYDKDNTWDICHVDGLPFFGDLVRGHYSDEKEIPAKYMQFSDSLFVFDKDDNPLGADIDEFPAEINGRFDLKFTPRFGTGSMYLTPRSKISDKIRSNCSFLDRKRWPKLS